MRFRFEGPSDRLYCPKCNNVMDKDNIDKSMTDNRKALMHCDYCSETSIFVIDFDMNQREEFERKKRNNELFNLAYVNRIVNGDNLHKYKINNYPHLSMYNMLGNNETCKDIIENYGKKVKSYNTICVLDKDPDYNISIDGQFMLLEIINKNNEFEYICLIGD